jgi:fucose permease
VAQRSQKPAGIGSFALELAVYGAFVFAYFFLVLRFLGSWLKHSFDQNRVVYAVVALVLIVLQGAVLETLTTRLLRWIRRRVD